MNKNNLDLVGWLVAAGLAGVLASSGFQGATEKLGTIDVIKVGDECDLGKSQRAAFADYQKQRQALIEFADQNRVEAPDQANKLRELWLKANPTDADKAALESTKADIQAATKKLVELNAKSNITPEERTVMEDFSRRAQEMTTLLNRWFSEFQSDMQNQFDSGRLSLLDKVRTAAKDVGKAQGYTIIFDTSAAPYSNSDISDATIASLNAAPKK